MAEFLQPELTTIALCWRLERRDGVALGFTTHDRDLAIGGLLYRAAPGMLPSAITLSDGFEADTLDIEGALSSDAIIGGGFAAGRWDGASVRVFMVDWEAPDGETLPVARGELGEVSIRGDAFEAELRGPAALLDAAVVEQTSPECRARLGDKRCRVDMAGRIERDADRGGRCGDDRGRGGGARAMLMATAGCAGSAARIAGWRARCCARMGRLLTLREPPAFRGCGRRPRRDSRGLRQEPGDLRGAVRECGQFPGRAASAGDRPADALSRGLRRPTHSIPHHGAESGISRRRKTMRLRACLGMILLGLGGCAHIPAHLLLDVDGSTVEIKKKVPPTAETNGAAPANDNEPAG